MERSFADAADNHHFTRARWRRLWRQQIQDYLIAAIQNVRILLAHQKRRKSAAAAVYLSKANLRYWSCYHDSTAVLLIKLGAFFSDLLYLALRPQRL